MAGLLLCSGAPREHVWGSAGGMFFILTPPCNLSKRACALPPGEEGTAPTSPARPLCDLVPAELRAAVPASDLPPSRRGAPCASRSVGAPSLGPGHLASRGAAVAAHHALQPRTSLRCGSKGLGLCRRALTRFNALPPADPVLIASWKERRVPPQAQIAARATASPAVTRAGAQTSSRCGIPAQASFMCTA